MKCLLNICLTTLIVLGTSNSLVLGENPTTQMCGLASSGTAPTGPFIPTTGTNKALIIYVQFSDDTFGSGTGGGAECTQDSVFGSGSKLMLPGHSLLPRHLLIGRGFSA